MYVNNYSEIEAMFAQNRTDSHEIDIQEEDRLEVGTVFKSLNTEDCDFPPITDEIYEDSLLFSGSINLLQDLQRGIENSNDSELVVSEVSEPTSLGSSQEELRDLDTNVGHASSSNDEGGNRRGRPKHFKSLTPDQLINFLSMELREGMLRIEQEIDGKPLPPFHQIHFSS